MDNAPPNGQVADSSRQQSLAQAFEMLRQRRTADAVQISDALLAAHPGNAEVLFLAS